MVEKVKGTTLSKSPRFTLPIERHWGNITPDMKHSTTYTIFGVLNITHPHEDFEKASDKLKVRDTLK